MITGVLKRFLETIEVISNSDYQYRIWVKGLGPEVNSYADTICDFFDDLEAIEEYKSKLGISDKQYQLIIQLRDALEIFSDEVPGMADPEKEILPNPEWNKIQKLAKEVLEAFDYRKDKDKYIFQFD